MNDNFNKHVNFTIGEHKIEKWLFLSNWQDHADNLINLGCQGDNAEFLLVGKCRWHVRWIITAVLLEIAEQLK